MKQILFLFFTFSGISAGFAQPEPTGVFRDSMDHTRLDVNTVKQDSTQRIEKYIARLYPNPARNKAQIEVMGFDAGWLQLKFYDARGNKLREEKRLLSTGNETITLMFLLQPGVYVLLLKQNKRSLKKILVVQ